MSDTMQTASPHHYSLDESFANGKQLCACVRGKDHPKADTGVPAEISVQTLGAGAQPTAPTSNDGARTFYDKVQDVQEETAKANELVTTSDEEIVGQRIIDLGTNPEAWAKSFTDNFEFDVLVNDTMIEWFKEAIEAGRQEGHQVGYRRGKEKARVATR